MFKLKSNYPQSFFTGAILRSKASLKQTTSILRVCLQIRGCSYKSLEFVNDLNTTKKTKKHGIYATQVVPLWVQLSWCFLLGAHFCQHQIWDPPPIGRPALPQVFSTTFRQENAKRYAKKCEGYSRWDSTKKHAFSNSKLPLSSFLNTMSWSSLRFHTTFFKFTWRMPLICF